MLGIYNTSRRLAQTSAGLRQICLALLLLLSTSQITFAAPLGTTCVSGPQPSASLFLPYFEVDLGDPEGMTTLISIGSRAEQSQMARVTLWTDLALPTLSFDLLIPSFGVVPINLRDIFTTGTLPVAPEGLSRPATCGDPLVQPTVGAAVLVAQHSGREFPFGSGECWASSRESDSVIGFLTVDALEDCSESIRYPDDEGYFAAGDSGLASQDNVLFGDFFFVEPAQDFAQGEALIHLPADRQVVGEGVDSFYQPLGSESEHDARRPLASFHRTRYLNGGAFTGGTSVLLWHAPLFQRDGPVDCRFASSGQGTQWVYQARDEASAGGELFGSLPSGPSARRVQIGQDIEVPGTSGRLAISAEFNCSVCSPPYVSIEPSVVLPLFSAEGRFSAGFAAVSIDEPCGP